MVKVARRLWVCALVAGCASSRKVGEGADGAAMSSAGMGGEGGA